MHHCFAHFWDAFRLKGLLEHGHLVEQDTELPDVTFVSIGLLAEHLGGHVLWRPDNSSCSRSRSCKDLRHAKVAELDDVAGVKEDIVAFDVTVKNFSIVAVLNSEAELCKVI